MNCASCRFHELEQMQGQIQRMMVCKWGPPTPSAVMVPPGAQGPGSPGGVMMQTLFPIVQPHQFCHQYETRPIANADLIPSDSD